MVVGGEALRLEKEGSGESFHPGSHLAPWRVFLLAQPSLPVNGHY